MILLIIACGAWSGRRCRGQHVARALLHQQTSHIPTCSPRKSRTWSQFKNYLYLTKSGKGNKRLLIVHASLPLFYMRTVPSSLLCKRHIIILQQPTKIQLHCSSAILFFFNGFLVLLFKIFYNLLFWRSEEFWFRFYAPFCIQLYLD